MSTEFMTGCGICEEAECIITERRKVYHRRKGYVVVSSCLLKEESMQILLRLEERDVK
jgi:hypothetical protein